MPSIISLASGSAQGYGFAAPPDARVYVEDVFSTYTYIGNSGTQTITNGLDLLNKGGLVWIKNRTNTGGCGHAWTDTARGPGTGATTVATNIIASNSTAGTGGGVPNSSDYLSAFTASGFTVTASTGSNNATRITNRASDRYISWAFEKRPKFFDIVTYTGTGANRTISHNLESVPGCIIIKRLDASFAWNVYHRSMGATRYNVLNTTAASVVDATRWNNTTPTATQFSLGTAATVNASGGSYVAYIFAHDAGGFGVSGTDNVISCGSFTGPSATVTLGYEPQWVLVKSSTLLDNWIVYDTVRGLTGVSTGANTALYPYTDLADAAVSANPIITSTGFTATGTSGETYIYIAIRRGPMKAPTSGTSVYSPIAYTGDNVANRQINTTITPDLSIIKARSAGALVPLWADRLRGQAVIYSSATAAEVNPVTGLSGGGQVIDTSVQTGIKLLQGTTNLNNINYLLDYASWNFNRAWGVFDTVCYTGNGATRTVSHNLGQTPELMIFKSRSLVSNWRVYSAAIWGTGVGGTPNFDMLTLNANSVANINNATLSSTQPTASVFTLSSSSDVNAAGSTYIAYLFATLSGVSKVGSYVGTGTTNQINCGFTGGARFVMIKRADNTGDWYVWDSSRGIVAGNDPYLLLNSTATEVTSTDYIDTYSAGFEISSTATAEINANGGTFIFLAIA